MLVRKFQSSILCRTGCSLPGHRAYRYDTQSQKTSFNVMRYALVRPIKTELLISLFHGETTVRDSWLYFTCFTAKSMAVKILFRS